MIHPLTSNEPASQNRCVEAIVIFDSHLEPGLTANRGSYTRARQLVMRTEEFDIHIKISDGRDHRQMLGQILPRSSTKFGELAKLHLLKDGERVETATADEMGEFCFFHLPEGELSIQIDLPNLTIVGALNFREMR